MVFEYILLCIIIDRAGIIYLWVTMLLLACHTPVGKCETPRSREWFYVLYSPLFHIHVYYIYIQSFTFIVHWHFPEYYIYIKLKENIIFPRNFWVWNCTLRCESLLKLFVLVEDELFPQNNNIKSLKTNELKYLECLRSIIHQNTNPAVTQN